MASMIVTGANQGIGYFLVDELLQEGHSVAVLDVETGRLEKLQKNYGDRLTPYVCDVRDGEAVNRCVAAYAGRVGRVDVAVHNACRCFFASMEQSPESLYREVMDTNFFGALHLCRAVLPYMKRQHSGRVIFTSSGAGVTGFGGISPYASSKGALEALAKCLKLEYQKDGITFHLFHPPLTRTKSAAPLPVPEEYKADPERVGRGLALRIPSKRFLLCHSLPQKWQVMACYLFPIKMGSMMNKMTQRLASK